MSSAKIGGLENSPIALVRPDPSWEERVRTRSWDIADSYRQAINNESPMSARIRWEAGEYIVEWKP